MSIICKNIGKTYQDLVVLEGINLEVETGEFVCLVGPSGCGKTTLLHIISGIETASSGTIQLPMPKNPQHSQTAMVFQDDNLFPWMTVTQNILFGMQNSGMSQAEQHKRARELVEMMKLVGFENTYPKHLSGGMRQRVGIARAFAANAEVLLMDEPFGALDAQTKLFMQEELLSIWWEHRQTVLYVTHDIDEALLLADRIYVFSTRPAHIKTIIPVELDRPRSLHDIDRPEIRELRWKIWKLLADSHPNS